MTTMDDQQKKRIEREQGDVNTTPDGLCKSLFCPGGSEAIEMAITLAKQVTGKFKTIEGNIITLCPALVITREEMDRALGILDTAIGDVEKGEPY